MLTVSLRRNPGEAGADAAVLERQNPAARAGDGDRVALALELLGGPWKPLVAWQLFWGPRRFGELVRQTPGVRPKRLRRTLAELERDGLVNKRTRSCARTCEESQRNKSRSNSFCRRAFYGGDCKDIESQ